MTSRGQDHRNMDPVHDSERIRAALGRILDSEHFANAERLKSFLSYVVEESIAGRADSILGKTIAEDVYARSLAEDDSGTNLVRVDAGRLRRKLATYYQSEGAEDAVLIQLESVGYAPIFEDQSAVKKVAAISEDAKDDMRHWQSNLVVLGFGLAVVTILGGVIYWSISDKTAHVPLDVRIFERQALASKSKATVQADNLCTQARGMLFPIANPTNQNIATDMFKQAIGTDPEYSCGYSGAAHSLATMSLLTREKDKRATLATEARLMADKSMKLAPKEGWSHSAIAWSAFAEKDFNLALQQSELALNLSPNDGNVRDFRATILLLNGEFDAARNVAKPGNNSEVGSYRFANRNIYAVSNFHLGNYRETIDALNAATELGDPVSALTVMYMAAAHQKLGNTVEANRLVEQLRDGWPKFQSNLLHVFYTKKEYTEDIFSALQAAGWNDPDEKS